MSFCSDTPQFAGLISVEYVLISEIDKTTYLPLVSNEYRSNTFRLKAGKTLKNVPFAGLEVSDRTFEQRKESSSKGTIWQQKVSGVIPAHSIETITLLNDFSEEVLLVVTDRNEKKWLLGTFLQPCKTDVSFSTNSNHHSITFSTSSLQQAIFFI